MIARQFTCRRLEDSRRLRMTNSDKKTPLLSNLLSTLLYNGKQLRQEKAPVASSGLQEGKRFGGPSSRIANTTNNRRY